MEDPVDEMDPQSHSGLTIKNRRKKFMKRKQLAALAAATVMALSMVGCGGGSSTSTETKAAEAGSGVCEGCRYCGPRKPDAGGY